MLHKVFVSFKNLRIKNVLNGTKKIATILETSLEKHFDFSFHHLNGKTMSDQMVLRKGIVPNINIIMIII